MLRFSFGKNWRDFLNSLNEERILSAQASLTTMLRLPSLENLTFLDIGSGSGLFSLAARRLGARVLSFDYDSDSVSCTNVLRNRFYPQDSGWEVKQGSVLDPDFLRTLGKYDIVYSWGVLHHTGEMWEAIANAKNLVQSNGLIFIAIYNDQGGISKLWRLIKKLYNRFPRIQVPLTFFVAFTMESFALVYDLLTLQNPIRRWRRIVSDRGMSWWNDWVDWVGGYPFEVAKPEDIFGFFRNDGFELVSLKTKGGGQGCCEYVFRKK